MTAAKITQIQNTARKEMMKQVAKYLFHRWLQQLIWHLLQVSL